MTVYLQYAYSSCHLATMYKAIKPKSNNTPYVSLQRHHQFSLLKPVCCKFYKSGRCKTFTATSKLVLAGSKLLGKALKCSAGVYWHKGTFCFSVYNYFKISSGCHWALWEVNFQQDDFLIRTVWVHTELECSPCVCAGFLWEHRFTSKHDEGIKWPTSSSITNYLVSWNMLHIQWG